MKHTLYRAICAYLLLVSIAHAANEQINQALNASQLDSTSVTRESGAGSQAIDSIDPFSGQVVWTIPLLRWPGTTPIEINWTQRLDGVGLQGLHLGMLRVTGDPMLIPGKWGSEPMWINPQGQSEPLHQIAPNLFRSQSGWRFDFGTSEITARRPDGYIVRFTHTRKEKETVFSVTPCAIQNGPNCSTPAETDLDVGYILPTRIESPQGEWQTIRYNELGRISEVRTSDGRSVNIGWDLGRAVPVQMQAGQRTWSFAFDQTATNLTIRRPDGASWDIEMQPEKAAPTLAMRPYFYLVPNKIKTPWGGSISYQYAWQPGDVAVADLCNRFGQDCRDDRDRTYFLAGRNVNGAVFWKKTTSDGGLWELLQNRPDTQGFVAAVPSSMRTLKAPDSETEYVYFGRDDFATCAEDRWKVGLPKTKQVKSLAGTVLETESTQWRPVTFSNSSHKGWNKCNGSSIRLGIPSNRTIQRENATYRVETTANDEWLRPTRVVAYSADGLPRVTNLSYVSPNDALWRLDILNTQTVAAGGATVSTLRQTHDRFGQVITQDRDGVTTKFSYDAIGQLSSVTSPTGTVSSFSDYYRSKPRRIVKPIRGKSEGATCTSKQNTAVWKSTVDEFGNILSETDPLNRTTRYTYDSLNRLASIAPMQGAQTSVVWTPNSRTLQRGVYREYDQYDEFGRTVNQITADRSVNYRYDPLGRVIFQSNPNQSSGKNSAYDGLGRLQRLTQADGSTISYLYQGAETVITNERGIATRYTHRAYGAPSDGMLLSVKTGIAAADVTIERDVLGKPLSVTQNNVRREWVYDSRQYLIKRVDPEVGATQFGRDAEGRIISRQVGQTTAVQYTYDAQGRLLASRYNDANTPDACNEYDVAGQLVRTNAGGVERGYTYDSNRNLTSEKLKIDSREFTLSHLYDDLDSRTAIIYPDQRRIDLVPDAEGRPRALGNVVREIQYNSWGLPRTWKYGNGLTELWAHSEQRAWPLSQVVAFQINDITPPIPPTEVPPPGVRPVPPTKPAVAEPDAISSQIACQALYPNA